jgi:hypothetical protein
MFHRLFNQSVYALAIFVTFLLIVGLPVASCGQVLEYRRTRRNRMPILVTLLIGGSYLAGGVIGWALRPAQWRLPFGKTLEVALNAGRYGHTLESQAEGVLMYPLYLAVLACVVVSVAAGLTLTIRSRAKG